MNCYKCKKCGERWYSAADLESLINKKCLCGGELELAKTECDNKDSETK